MSSLRSVLDEVTAVDFAELPDGRLEEEFGELQRGVRVLEAHLLRCLAEIDRRATYRAGGHLSTSSWLAGTFGSGHGTAKEQVRTARALEGMSATREAYQAGELSRDVVRVLASAKEAAPEAFRDYEAALLQAAERHTVRELVSVVRYWIQAVDWDRGLSREERQWRSRHLHVSPLLDGMVRVDGTLDQQTGETLLTAIRAVTDAEARHSDPEDDRTPGQRRADALGKICRQSLDSADRPTVGGERPHVELRIDLDTLTGSAGQACELANTGPTPLHLARILACDAAVTRVVLGPGSEPLDVGRKTRVVSSAIRRAVVARDRHCPGPGCDASPDWCDCHHVEEWPDGGVTAVRNLVLLCRRHHGLVHRRILRVEMVDGRPVFRRSDGSVVEDRAPP